MSRGRAPILLVLAGSFNPPHLAHLRMLELARDTLRAQSCTVLGGVMTPVHDLYRKKSLIPYTHRHTMVQLATQNSWVKCSGWEGAQDAWSPTVKTLAALQAQAREEYGEPGLVASLICGADLLESFNVPGLWQDTDIENILQNHGLIVVRRPGSDPEKFIFGHKICTKYVDKILIAEEEITNDVSSTVLRKLAGEGNSIRYLTVDAVCDYVRDNKLYQ